LGNNSFGHFKKRSDSCAYCFNMFPVINYFAYCRISPSITTAHPDFFLALEGSKSMEIF